MTSFYRTQSRRLMYDPNTPPVYPNDARISVVIEPSECLGVGSKPSRSPRAGMATALVDVYSGRVGWISNSPLDPISFSTMFENANISVEGNIITLSCRVNDIQELASHTLAIEIFLPRLLNLEIFDCPSVVRVSGSIGNVPFTIGFQTTAPDTRGIDPSGYAKDLIDMIQTLPIFGFGRNVRLAASLDHFYTACRLLRVGRTEWEFMAEAILNLAKALESLFVQSANSREDIRNGLKEFGIQADRIETDFIPILVLRNDFSVAHFSLSSYPSDQLETIYRFLMFAESRFRSLLSQMIKKISSGYFTLKETELVPTEKKLKSLGKLTDSMRKRLPPLPDVDQYPNSIILALRKGDDARSKYCDTSAHNI
jgi:hypothetical protein